MDCLSTPFCLTSCYRKRWKFEFICASTTSITNISKFIENIISKLWIQGNFCCKPSRFPDKRVEIGEINVTRKLSLSQETEFFFEFFFRIVALTANAWILIEWFSLLFAMFFYIFLGFLWIIFTVKQIFLRNNFSLRSNKTLFHEFALIVAMFTSSRLQHCMRLGSCHYFIVLNLSPRWSRCTFFVVLSRIPVFNRHKKVIFPTFILLTDKFAL